MNIQEAKREVKRSVAIYLTKDEFGNYRIPVEKQRPIFLIGAPGIGKTAIMEQIAEEMNLSLVSYSMTHHTRQSALGLPFIVHKEFDGKPYDVTNYTMSEIISSIYDTMEESGIREGILFLDEINCISETLAPSMLQFLQYKTFGTHQVPEGWVIVTAGNPPEYNRSVREFDVVTLDRLRLLEITPDFEAWKIYAKKRGVHKAILTYLEIHQDNFYHMENTAHEKRYVTARGWEDLSEALYLYEEKGFPVDEILIGQYIRSPRIAREFATYYALYEKYKSDYQIPSILLGREGAEIRDRARAAGFDERLTITGLLLEAIQPRIRKHMEKENALKMLHGKLAEMKESETGSIHDSLQKLKDQMEREQKQKKAAGNLSRESIHAYAYCLRFVRACWDRLDSEGNEKTDHDFALVNQEFQERVQEMLQETPRLSEELDHLFTFVEDVFGDDNEMLVLVTELTVDKNAAAFIAENGCSGYYRHNKRLMVFERNQELMEEIEDIEDMRKNGQK